MLLQNKKFFRILLKNKVSSFNHQKKKIKKRNGEIQMMPAVKWCHPMAFFIPFWPSLYFRMFEGGVEASIVKPLPGILPSPLYSLFKLNEMMIKARKRVKGK